MAECRLHLCHKGMADSYTAPLEDFKKDANGARAPTGHFRCGAERAKRFVNVNLHCNISTLKTISKMSTLPPFWKIYADAHGCFRSPFQQALMYGNQAKAKLIMLFFLLLMLLRSNSQQVSNQAADVSPTYSSRLP